MTIAVAVRTGSAVVFAADSKVTTSGLVGLEEDGSPRLQDQTYDNAYKIVHDRSKQLMAMVAGYVNIGQASSVDYISTRNFLDYSLDKNQAIDELVNEMHAELKRYWSTTKVPPDKWPGPTLVLATASSDRKNPRVWRVKLDGEKPEIAEILTDPGIRLEGSYDEAFTLLFGYDYSVLQSIARDLNVEEKKIIDSVNGAKVLRPLDKLNLWSMPIQDAMDLAVFLAKVQVEMDRFLPGTPVCGGPIDVMVLQMAPIAEIHSFPGKIVHHPHISGQ